MSKVKEKLLAFRDGFERLAGHILFPQGASCQVCGEYRLVDENYALCADCMKKLEMFHVPASACRRCLFPMRSKHGCSMCKSGKMKDINASFSPFCYRNQVRKLIHEFKFENNASFIAYLADQMADALTDRSFTALVPVPLNQRRLYDRGQNQAALLALALSERTGIPVMGYLERSGYQKPQSETPLHKREKNIKDCFHAKQNLKGERLLLIDDVRTTGSTAQACAKELKRAGATYVGLCTVAVVYRNPSKFHMQQHKKKKRFFKK